MIYKIDIHLGDKPGIALASHEKLDGCTLLTKIDRLRIGMDYVEPSSLNQDDLADIYRQIIAEIDKQKLSEKNPLLLEATRGW